MLPEIDLDRVGRYRDSIGNAWKHGDSNVWPVKLNAALHLFAKEFGEELLEDLTALEAEGRSLAEIARPFGNPARLYRIIDTTIYSMRRNRLPLREQRQVVLKLLAMTRALKHGSEFNEDGRNIIYGPDDVARAAAAVAAGPVTTSESQLVHRFCGAMWAYTESIFFRAHDVTKEIHGPYDAAGGGRRFIVKEYFHLRPTELWPDVPLLPCQTIKVVKQYSEAVHMRIDALNHLYLQGAGLVPSLQACCVEVDGRRRDVALLSEYLAVVRQTISAIAERVETMTWNDRVARYAEIFWFRKRPLRTQRGLDWHVPPHVRAAIAEGEEHQRRRVQLSDEASERLAMLTI